MYTHTLEDQLLSLFVPVEAKRLLPLILHFHSCQNLPMRIPLFSWLFFMPMICLLSFSFSISTVRSQCDDDQQSMLLQLKNNLVFDNASSTKLVHWNPSVDCCSWEGVSCEEEVFGLDLANESISGELNNSYSDFRLEALNNLSLAHNKLKTFPSFLIDLGQLFYLDLSDNQIHGDIPNWIWKYHLLQSLNLSYNYLKTTNMSLLSISNMRLLDLGSNQLQGKFSIFLNQAQYLDFSRNNFSSVIPANIGNFLSNTYFFSLSSNKLYGSIPRSICNATNLIVLDLSNNFLSGTVPRCLFKLSEVDQEMSKPGLGVLNLSKNNLTGTISNVFPSNCGLQTLSLNGNQLEGKLPKSLSRCTSLDILNLGNNHIEDAFPCFLKNIFTLHILILRSNKFYWPINCLGLNASWPKLQIVDLTANNFTGKFPIKYFSNWKAMIDEKIEVKYVLNHLYFEKRKGVPNDGEFHEPKVNHDLVSVIDIYYQDVVIVTMKGLEAKLVKILSIFTALDFSCNNFEGPIPGEIGELKLLLILNLSHNAFTGPIPQSLGELTYLESLDLSNNKFTGEIPVQLADGLIFLSVLNFSFNQLMGQIPQIKQFATFSKTSYAGNRGLCGIPLKEKCTHEKPRSSTPTSEETHSNLGNAIDWNFVCVELGFVFGFGIVIGPLMFWKRWRICYYKHVDNIFFKMFPQLYIRIENSQRRAHMNQGQRAHRNQGHRH